MMKTLPLRSWVLMLLLLGCLGAAPPAGAGAAGAVAAPHLSAPAWSMGEECTVTWTSAAGVGSYTAQCAAEPGFTTPLQVFDVDPLSSEVTFGGLENGKTYWFRVRGNLAAGGGTGWSNVVSSIQDTTPPAGSSLKINGGASGTVLSTVTLTLAAQDAGAKASGVAQMRLGADGTHWTAWEPYAASRKYLLNTTRQSQQVFAQFQDRAGNISAALSATIALQAGPLYVRAGADSLAADGSTAHPFAGIATALDNAWAASTEINVAEGTYYGPLAMKSNITLRGGFPGGSFDPARRNPAALATIITISTATYSNIVTLDAVVNVTIDGVRIGVSTFTFSHDVSGVYCRNLDRSCQLTNCTIFGVRSTGYYVYGTGFTTIGGGISCDAASPRVAGCLIQDNQANWGGGLYLINGSAPLFERCWIRDNNALTIYRVINTYGIYQPVGGEGGGAYCENSAPVFQNCLITNNTSGPSGGGVLGSSGAIQNCTIKGNVQGLVNCSGAIRNCLVWANATTQLAGCSTPSYSCIQGWTGGGTGNLATEPLFVNTAVSDFHIQAASPCVDAGGAVAGLTTDYDGNRRPVVVSSAARGDGSHLDIGAYEYQPPAPVAATPQITPASGTYASSPVTVTLGCVTTGASIYYTTNGAEPTASSFLYKAPLSILLTPDVTTTLKAKAFKTGYTASATTVRTYTIKTPAELCVDAANTAGPWDGTRAHPFKTVPPALAGAGIGTRILVAQGTYYGPITMKNGVTLLGGYTSGNFGAARNPEINQTTLTLSLAGAATGAALNVVMMNGVTSATLDGFRIGRVNGGERNVVGVYCAGGGATCRIANCRIAGLSGYSYSVFTPRPGAAAPPATYGSGILCNGASPQIVYCTIEGSVANYGGGIYCANGAAPLIDRCLIRDNRAVLINTTDFTVVAGCGGGVFCDHASPTIRNCIITGNTAEAGGGVAGSSGGTVSSLPAILNCTVVGNTTGIYRLGGRITNCIVWGNRTGQLSSAAAPTYCCVQGWTGGGTGNLAADPQFVNAAAGNYYLQASSPCIDAGARVAGVTVDYAGVARGTVGWPAARGDGSRFDIGAYEFFLGAPGISPAAGAYAAPLNVTLSGPAGATLRYTTDGSEPVVTSRLYSGPFQVNPTATKSVTVKARAFQGGLTPSATTTRVYSLPAAP